MQVKIQGQNEEMLATACQQFLGKPEMEVRRIAQETLEGHQRAIMGNMTVEVLRGPRDGAHNTLQFYFFCLFNSCLISLSVSLSPHNHLPSSVSLSLCCLILNQLLLVAISQSCMVCDGCVH